MGLIRLFSCLCAFCLILSACSAPAAQPATLTIMAAASLAEAFNEIGDLFEAQHAGVKVEFNFAGSQQLAQQLAQGAPADVFASANLRQMEAVVEAGRVEPSAPQTFARNRLVVIYPTENPAGITALQDLAKPGVKLILADTSVPAGQYTLGFLDKASNNPAYGTGFRDQLLQNVVSYEDNVRAVLTKVTLGEADAGIVYTSDVVGENAAEIAQLEIPDEINVIAEYPIAPIKDSQNPVLAQAFIDLVLSEEGQGILNGYSFSPIR